MTITNPLFTSCAETITIDFVVNELPSFDIDDPTVICLNPLPGQPVEIGTSKSWNWRSRPLYLHLLLDATISDPAFTANYRNHPSP